MGNGEWVEAGIRDSGIGGGRASGEDFGLYADASSGLPAKRREHDVAAPAHDPGLLFPIPQSRLPVSIKPEQRRGQALATDENGVGAAVKGDGLGLGNGWQADLPGLAGERLRPVFMR